MRLVKHQCNCQLYALAYAQEAKVLYPDVPVILVGTKIDLRNSDDIKIREKCWSKEDMEYFSILCNCDVFDEYIECSSLKDINIKQVFQFAAKHAIKYKKLKLLKLLKNKKKCIIM